jgi:hypothetical protein
MRRAGIAGLRYFRRMQIRIHRALGFAMLTLRFLAAAHAAAITHTTLLFPDSLKIDGVLDEPAWKGADTIALAMNNDPAGGAPGVATKVLTGWSRTRLYVAFIVESKNVQGTMTMHDANLYEQDVVEMFLDPDGDGKNYIELEWNCLNTSYDQTFTAPLAGGKLDWSPQGILNAVKVHGTANKSSDTDTSWVLEISLPWTAIQAQSLAALPPKSGDKLPLNFYRIDHSSGAEKLMSWSPTGAADFHRPDKFGSLVFSDTPVTSVFTPAKAGKASVGPRGAGSALSRFGIDFPGAGGRSYDAAGRTELGGGASGGGGG